jgi:hypothetical protein
MYHFTSITCSAWECKGYCLLWGLSSLFPEKELGGKVWVYGPFIGGSQTIKEPILTHIKKIIVKEPTLDCQLLQETCWFFEFKKNLEPVVILLQF